MNTSTTEAKRIASACYPEYKGRKVKLAEKQTYYADNVWGGGSRCFAKSYELATGAVREFPAVVGEIAIPEGFAVVEHTFFYGKDCGITISVNRLCEICKDGLAAARETAAMTKDRP